MVKAKTKVLIIGGGFGGVKLALELANQPGFSVQLISDNTHFEYHGALYRSAVGYSPKEVVIPLSQIFEGKENVELVLDSAGYIDEKKKLVISTTGESYPYDVLVCSLGNTVNYFGIKGLAEHAETMHDIGSTMKLRRRLTDLFAEPQHRSIRIAVVGGGPSGIELISELPAFAELVAKRHNKKVPKLQLVLVEAAPRLLPNLSEESSRKVAKRLIKLGVELHLNNGVKSCRADRLKLSAGELDADIVIWTAGSKPVAFYEANSQLFTPGKCGRVVVDEYLRPAGKKDVFILGDNADTKYSGMAQTAIYDASFVARNLKRAHNNQKMMTYRARKPLYVITAGGKWALVEKNRRVISGRRGWRIRRQADLWIFKHFEPYKQAIKTWRNGNRLLKSF